MLGANSTPTEKPGIDVGRQVLVSFGSPTGSGGFPGGDESTASCAIVLASCFARISF